MPNFSFSEILILILICLLFAKDFLPAFLSKFLGVKVNGKNGNGYQPQIDELKEHAKVANEEMKEVAEKLTELEIGQARIEGKINILIQIKNE